MFLFETVGVSKGAFPFKEIPVEKVKQCFILFSGAHGPRCPTSFIQHHRVAQHGGILLMETRRILPNLMHQTRFSSVKTRGSCATFLCWRDIKWGKRIILFLKRDVSTSKMLAMEKFFFFFLNFLISVILLF